MSFLGADQIALNGDTANKIGTYSLAVLAHHHKIPFYVVAPVSTINQRILSGSAIKIEERPALELITFNGRDVLEAKKLICVKSRQAISSSRYASMESSI